MTCLFTWSARTQLLSAAIAPATHARLTNDLNAVRMLLGPRPHVLGQHRLLHPRRVFFVLHISPLFDVVALAPHARCEHPGAILRNPDSRSFRTHPGQLFRDLFAAQENYSGARLGPRLCREESQIASSSALNRQYIARSLRLVQLMGMLWPTLEFILGVSMVITLSPAPPGPGASHLRGDFVAFNTYMVMLIWPSSPSAGSSISSREARLL